MLLYGPIKAFALARELGRGGGNFATFNFVGEYLLP